jgi:hypothetical protein
VVDIEPCDISAPPRVSGSDLIDYLMSRADLSDPFRWGRSAEVIDPARTYTMSLQADPNGSVTRWTPPEGSGLPTVLLLSQASETTLLIRH